MRILHWNVHSWTDAEGVDNVDRVIDLLRGEKPDVVSFVEVDEPWGDSRKLRRIAETLDYHWIFVPAFEYRESGGFGNALLSLAPFETVDQWQLLSPRIYDGSERSEPRSLVMATVRYDGMRLLVGSTHLPRSDDVAHKAAGKRVCELLAHRAGSSAVICGDFNRPPDAWLSDPDLKTLPNGPTYPADEPTEAIDYFVLAGDMSVRHADTLESQASDHLAVVVDIDLR